MDGLVGNSMGASLCSAEDPADLRVPAPTTARVEPTGGGGSMSDHAAEMPLALVPARIPSAPVPEGPPLIPRQIPTKISQASKDVICVGHMATQSPVLQSQAAPDMNSNMQTVQTACNTGMTPQEAAAFEKMK